MAAFTAKDVSSLRQRTGAGMMECKKALEENEGNMEQAIDWLRKKGIAKAEKRAGRATSEGKIVGKTTPDGKTGVLVELNSETDFVSRNESFGAAVDKIADTLLATTSIDGVTANAEGSPLMAAAFGDSGTLEETLKHMTGTIGENIVLRRYARFSGDAVGVYAHHNSKIAAMVELAGITGAAGQELARTIAEHLAAGVPTVPVAVNRDEVPAELVERERNIFTEQAAASGKPANIIEKMVSGRIDKYYKEVTLIDQPWIRDDSKSIADLVKAAGAGVTIKRIARFQMGQE
jgi:elongation factor Ts